MNLSFRVGVAVGILILAAAGCQQGKQPGATGKAESKGEAAGGARSKAAKAHTVAAARGTSTAEARDGGAGSSRSSGRLTAADDGSSFDLRQGQVVTVVLESNRPSGLKWILVESSGGVIVPAASPVYVARSAKSGGGGTETWRFRAARPGKQTVRLEYRRQWQQVPERAFRFSVTVR